MDCASYKLSFTTYFYTPSISQPSRFFNLQLKQFTKSLYMAKAEV